MSKAFTRDNDDAEPVTIPRRAEIPSGGHRYLTVDGAERLRAELASLEDRLRGREHADKKDDDARQELRRIKGRLQTISETLTRAEIVAIPEGAVDIVRFGLFVTVRHKDGVEDDYRLVGVDEVDLDERSISWLSPLAQALLGRKVGDEVRFQAPAGEQVLRIVRIRTAA